MSSCWIFRLVPDWPVENQRSISGGGAGCPHPVSVLTGLAGLSPPSVYILVGFEEAASVFSVSFCVSDPNTSSVSFFQECMGPLPRNPGATTVQPTELAGRARREALGWPGVCRAAAQAPPQQEQCGGTGLVPFTPSVLCISGSYS